MFFFAVFVWRFGCILRAHFALIGKSCQGPFKVKLYPRMLKQRRNKGLSW
jgi:hypothetical protein